MPLTRFAPALRRSHSSATTPRPRRAGPISRCCGFTGSAATAAARRPRRCGRVAPRGWTFAAFDFRGHGDSAGTMHELRPAICGRPGGSALLADRGHTRLGLVGSSMGGFASAWFARQNPRVVGCVLLAPAFGFLERRWNRLTDAERASGSAPAGCGYERLGRHRNRLRAGRGAGAVPPGDLAAGWRDADAHLPRLADDVVPGRGQSGSLARGRVPACGTTPAQGRRPPADGVQGRDRRRSRRFFGHLL